MGTFRERLRMRLLLLFTLFASCLCNESEDAQVYAVVPVGSPDQPQDGREVAAGAGIQLGPLSAGLNGGLGLSGLNFGGGLGFGSPHQYYSYPPTNYRIPTYTYTRYPTTYYTSPASRGIGGGANVQFGPIGAGLGGGIGFDGIHFGGGIGPGTYYYPAPQPVSYYPYHYSSPSSSYYTTYEPTARHVGAGVGVQFGPLGAGIAGGLGPQGFKAGAGLGFDKYGHYGTSSHYSQYYKPQPVYYYS